MTVNLDPPPGDSSNYGYAVYRLTVTNRGPAARTVTVTLPAQSYGSGDHLRGLTKTLRVGPNATAAADLTQPAIPLSGDSARVAIDGSAQRDLLPVDLVDHDAYGEGDLILVGRGVPEAVRVSLLDGLNAWQERLDNAGTTGGYGGGYGVQPVPELIRADRPATEFSDNWLFYTRYLAVMLSEAEARQLNPPAAAALRDYVAAGGIVMLVGEGGTMPEMPDSWRGAWTHELTQPILGAELSHGLGRFALLGARDAQKLRSEELEARFEAWQGATSDRRVVVGAEGAESRLPMLENIAVPVRGLLILMLVFTLVIGPVNLAVLHVIQRRMWLLWTIPVIAFTFAGAVLIYSLFSEGISPRARSVAVTLLDQTTRQAVTVGAIGYYAPLTPGGGLTFGEQTLVAPQYGDEHYGFVGHSNSGRPRTLDLTSGQHLSSGWIAARVPAHFTLRKPETMRERLDISRDPASGGLRVVNGLGKPIRVLHLMDAEGRGYVVNDLAPGASAVATSWPMNPDLIDIDSVQEVLDRFGLWAAPVQLAALQPHFLEPSTYLAVLDNATFLEPGLDDLTDHEATGVVVGYWEEAE